MCTGVKRETACIVLHVLLSLVGFNVIYGQEISTYTFVPTTSPTTNRPTTLPARPHQLTTSTSTSSSIDRFPSRFSTTNLPKTSKIANLAAKYSVKDIQENHISIPSHYATQRSRNLVSNTNGVHQQTSVHARNRDPSRKETFLGQVTLNSPAELPPQFNREELAANFRIGSDNSSEHDKGRIKFPERNKYRRTKISTDGIEFATNKSLLTTQMPIFAPLYFAFKPTRYTIMPKNKLLDLEPLLEEPMNRKEYYKHNKQDVQVIISTATTELSGAFVNMTIGTEVTDIDRNDSRILPDIGSKDQLQPLPTENRIVNETRSSVTTEGSKNTEYAGKAEATSETTESTDDIKMNTSSSTIRTTVKLPTTTNPATSIPGVNTINTEAITQKTIDRSINSSDLPRISRKPPLRNIQETLNITSTTSNLEMDKLRQPLAINIQLRETTGNRLFDQAPLPSSLLGKTNGQREFKKQQALSGTIKIFLKGPSFVQTTTKPPSKLNGTFWKGSLTTTMLGKPTKHSRPPNNISGNGNDDEPNLPKGKLSNSDDILKKNRPLALIKSWSAGFNRQMEPSADAMPIPLTTAPPKRGFFETSPKFSQSLLATRISEFASFNVCSGKCELAGIIKLIDGVTWTPALSDRSTRGWRNLASEIQLQLEKTYTQSSVLRRWYRSIRVDGFSEGSVLVDYIVEFDNTGKQINTLELRRLFHESLNLREKLPGNAMRLGNFTIDPLYTDFIVLPPVSSTVIEYVENNLLPQWAIAVIVIGLASFLFVIIFAITILTNRRKTNKRKTTPPFNEDIFDEMNKKVLGIDNYGVDNIYNME